MTYLVGKIKIKFKLFFQGPGRLSEYPMEMIPMLFEDFEANSARVKNSPSAAIFFPVGRSRVGSNQGTIPRGEEERHRVFFIRGNEILSTILDIYDINSSGL